MSDRLDDQRAGLDDVFDRARRLGLIGTTSTDAILAHTLGYAEHTPAPHRAADLGSGAGIPGLVLALVWPDSRWVLVEQGDRRATFLDQATRDLDLAGRVEVWAGPAEACGRSHHRGRIDLVVARAFGPPPVVAECAAPLLRVGGHLVVSEPPEPVPERWAGLESTDLGLAVASRWTSEHGSFAAFVQQTACPERYPRRPSVPAKRPLF